MRERSTETKFREALRDLKRARLLEVEMRRERDMYRVRASKAEQDVADWKSRFDALLYRTPKLPE